MSERPHVLLICVDHWAGSLLGCAGHPVIATPTLDQLARNGVRFSNAYTECPVCIPARRTLMTGRTPHGHGLLTNRNVPMPDGVPTVASCFRDAGYQCYAVGKLHVTPQRQRLGFDEVLLDEEGRGAEGCKQDDYELFLGDNGHPGERFTGGMCNNAYMWRPWHLAERLHPTNWAASHMARTIRRRDPLRPAFWYLSFSHPHPPLVPLQAYLDMFRDREPEVPLRGEWSESSRRGALPWFLRRKMEERVDCRPFDVPGIRRAFYSLCTQIDHQIRIVLGALREEGLSERTVVMFTSDHGDMLGDHGMWDKLVMYEGSARVPLILSGLPGDDRVGEGRVDERLVGLSDIMPTLLDLCGLPVPAGVEGIPMTGTRQRDHLFAVYDEGNGGTRMIRRGPWKLIYYARGNAVQLFHLGEDPGECRDRAEDPAVAEIRHDLERRLMGELRGDERAWIADDRLCGTPDQPWPGRTNRAFDSQRGPHWPPP